MRATPEFSGLTSSLRLLRSRPAGPSPPKIPASPYKGKFQGTNRYKIRGRERDKPAASNGVFNRCEAWQHLLCGPSTTLFTARHGLFFICWSASSVLNMRGVSAGGDQARIRPLVEMVTTCRGMAFPQRLRACLTAHSSPPQQGTSMRVRVMLRMLLRVKISVSFSL